MQILEHADSKMLTELKSIWFGLWTAGFSAKQAQGLIHV